MTSPQTTVSCVMPVYNGASYIAEAVHSVLKQTWGSIELIVVDDGSTDDTAQVAQSFGAALRYVRQDNAGPATARNRGVAEATGSYICFLDADDLWLEHKIARQMQAFTDDPDLDYCVGLVQNFWADEVRHEATRMAGHPKAAPLPGYVTGTLVARRQAFERLGWFDRSLGHGDSADWFVRAREAGLRERLLQEVLLLRRMHTTNRSRQMADRSRDEFLRFLKGSLDRRRTRTDSE